MVIACCTYFAVASFNFWLRFKLQPQITPDLIALQFKMAGKTKPAKHIEQQKKQERIKFDPAHLQKRNIFGGPAQRENPATLKMDLSNIPLAKHLNEFKLLGTIVLSSGPGLAIIEDRRKKHQDIYKQGDLLGQAKITKIVRNHVIVQFNGQEEMLSIEPGKDQKNRQRTVEAIPSRTLNYSLPQKYIEQALLNLPQIFKQARITPYLQDGQAKGFQLRQIKRNSLFRKLHLINGDVILKANGHSLQGPQDVLTLAREIQSREEASLEIKRRNKIIIIRYHLIP